MQPAIIPEEYNCSICWNIYCNPIKLACNHNFCYHCIYFWLESEEEGIKCPKCRRFYPITMELKPDTSLSDYLRKNYPKEYSKQEKMIGKLMSEESKIEKIKVLYGNYLYKQDTNKKIVPEWRFYVKLADSKFDILNYIEKIEVNLDPAYGSKPISLVKPPFEIRVNFGAEMDITCKIFWKKKLEREPLYFIYYVAFNNGEGKMNSYLLSIKK